MTVEYVESSRLPTPWGIFEMHGFIDVDTDKEHILLTMGDVKGDESILVRVHSECLTGDALFSMRCDCGAQLQSAMHKIALEGRGAIFYLRQEGRGIGLINKIRAYNLQDKGADTVEANEQLGFDADIRKYDMLENMFAHAGIKKVRVMTNNPRKLAALRDAGIEVESRLAHEPGRNRHNANYLETKQGKLGHIFEADHTSTPDPDIPDT
ncbi:MAG: GTP cyclohydrolase II [Alteromonadaceae bacterium]|nr:MAG: GTP cyclohydrolase II [Alteromonadaceae bacterium]